MRLVINGEPHIVHHECLPERKGKKMTWDELHAFAVKTLKEEYSMYSTNVMIPSIDYRDAADFCFFRDDVLINVKVVYSETLDIDFSQIDTSPIVDRFYKYGEIPRLTVASAWCFDSDSGKPEICGGSFCFKYYSFSLIPDEKNHPLPEMLTPIQLASKYADAWRFFNADLIEPYLDKDFHYSSCYVFDVMPSRYEYMDYFRGKLNTISKNPNLDSIIPTYVGDSGKAGVIIRQRNNNPGILLLETRGGRIIYATMKEYIPKPGEDI
jgi:hypothetical protein